MADITQVKLEVITPEYGTYDLTDLVNFDFTDGDNFGMAGLRRLTQRGPMQHGVSDVGFRLDPRQLLLTVRGLASDEAGYYAARALLLKVFKPRAAALGLRISLPPSTVRQIDCHFSGRLTLPWSTREGMIQRDVVQLFAPDPTWYDPVTVTTPFQQVGGGTGMPFPLLFPFTLGASTLAQSSVITNAGSWITYPRITITGPITNPVITNSTTGEKLDFTGHSVGNGDYYVIDTRYGYKTVTDAAGANQIAMLTADSDLATFHFEPGDNSVSIAGTLITAATSIVVSHYARYVGV